VAGILETETESDPQKISDLDEWIRIFVEADRETRQHLLDIARSVRVSKVKPPHQS
jgi:hypothetical protein